MHIYIYIQNINNKINQDKTSRINKSKVLQFEPGVVQIWNVFLVSPSCSASQVLITMVLLLLWSANVQTLTEAVVVQRKPTRGFRPVDIYAIYMHACSYRFIF